MKQNTFLFLLAIGIIAFGQCVTKPKLPEYIEIKVIQPVSDYDNVFLTYLIKPIDHDMFAVYTSDTADMNTVLVPEDNWPDEPREYKIFVDQDLIGYLYEKEMKSLVNVFEFIPYE